MLYRCFVKCPANVGWVLFLTVYCCQISVLIGPVLQHQESFASGLLLLLLVVFSLGRLPGSPSHRAFSPHNNKTRLLDLTPVHRSSSQLHSISHMYCCHSTMPCLSRFADHLPLGKFGPLPPCCRHPSCICSGCYLISQPNIDKHTANDLHNFINVPIAILATTCWCRHSLCLLPAQGIP